MNRFKEIVSGMILDSMLVLSCHASREVTSAK